MVDPISSNDLRRKAQSLPQQDDKKPQEVQNKTAPQKEPEIYPYGFTTMAVPRKADEFVVPVVSLIDFYFDAARGDRVIENIPDRNYYRAIPNTQKRDSDGNVIDGTEETAFYKKVPGLLEGDVWRKSHDVAKPFAMSKASVVTLAGFLKTFYTSPKAPDSDLEKNNGKEVDLEIAKKPKSKDAKKSKPEDRPDIRPDLLDRDSYLTWEQIKQKNIFVGPNNPFKEVPPDDSNKSYFHDAAANPQAPPTAPSGGSAGTWSMSIKRGNDYQLVTINIVSAQPVASMKDFLDGLAAAKKRDKLSDEEEESLFNAYYSNAIIPTESFEGTAYKDLPKGFKLLDTKQDLILDQREWVDGIAGISGVNGKLYRGLNKNQFYEFVNKFSLNETLLDKYPKGASIIQLAELHEKYALAAAPGGERGPGQELAGFGVIGMPALYDPEHPRINLFAPMPKKADEETQGTL